MFMEPFTGIISRPLQELALGSVGGSVGVATAAGSSEETAMLLGSFLYMPGWFVAALFSNIGL